MRIQRVGGTSKLHFFEVCAHDQKPCVSHKHTHTQKKIIEEKVKQCCVCHSNCLYTELWSPIIYNDMQSVHLMKYQCLVHLSSFLLSMVVGVGLTCCCSPPFTVDSVEKISSPVPLSLSEVIWVSFRLVFSTPPSSSNTCISRSL